MARMVFCTEDEIMPNGVFVAAGAVRWEDGGRGIPVTERFSLSSLIGRATDIRRDGLELSAEFQFFDQGGLSAFDYLSDEGVLKDLYTFSYAANEVAGDFSDHKYFPMRVKSCRLCEITIIPRGM